MRFAAWTTGKSGGKIHARMKNSSLDPNQARYDDTVYCSPQLTMVGLVAERIEPEEEPRASISLTTFMDSASATSPKTTCLPSSQEVTTVVMKNWEPLLEEWA